MDSTCWTLIGGLSTTVVVLGGVIVRLFELYRKSQESRLKEATENSNTLKVLYETTERKRR